MNQVKLISAALVAALVVGLVIALVVVSRGRREAALRADSAEAAADTTKKIAGAFERRAVQAELLTSVLDEALKAKPKVVFRTVVKFDTVRIDSAIGGPVVEVEGTRRGSVAFQQEPVSFAADVEIPPPPGAVKLLNARIGISPLPIIPRVSCSIEAVNGIHRAHVALDSLPRWARVEIHDAQASPDVCNPRGGISLGLKLLPWWIAALAGVGGFLGGLAVSK